MFEHATGAPPPDHPDAPTSPRNAWVHGLRLAAASERLVAQLRATLGLSSNEMNAVLLLHEDGACTMSELARQVQLSRGALSVLVHRLERDGWLELADDPHDRRRVIVALTDRFGEELSEASRAWRQRLQNLASASECWDEVVEHIDGICRIATRSARELHDELAVRRRAR